MTILALSLNAKKVPVDLFRACDSTDKEEEAEVKTVCVEAWDAQVKDVDESMTK